MAKAKEVTLEDVMQSGRTFMETPRRIIPISPANDVALGGGITDGAVIILTGPPKFGKTVTALTIAAEAQKAEHGARDVFYFNIEERFKTRDIIGIAGLDPDKIH